MKRLQISLLAVFALGGTARATHVSTADSTVLADSLERVETLREFTVEGRSQRVIKNGVEYTPDKKIKRVAYNSATLLMHMQIPQLSVSPGDMSIKTLGSNDVSVFIDYRKASNEDYNTPEKSIGAWSNGVRKSIGSTYGLYAGYNTGGFNVALQFRNWFGGHSYLDAELNNPRLLYYTRQWNASLARSVSLSLTYTFGYGKKVSHNDELQGGATQSNSAILK